MNRPGGGPNPPPDEPPGDWRQPPWPGEPPPGPDPGPGRRTATGTALRIVVGAVALGVVGWLLAEHHSVSSDDVILFCVLVPSIVLHEIAHGWVALAFGDDTAKAAGRLSFNPARHVDPLGTVIVPAVMLLSSHGFAGWAKPVPVNTGRLRRPRDQGLVVALAGPATNVVLMGLALAVFAVVGAKHQWMQFQLGQANLPVWWRVLYYFGFANLGLALFNLLPVPPLDGSALIDRLVPAHAWDSYLRFRQRMFFVLLIGVIVVLNVHWGSGSIIDRVRTDVESWWQRLLGLN